MKSLKKVKIIALCFVLTISLTMPTNMIASGIDKAESVSNLQSTDFFEESYLEYLTANNFDGTMSSEEVVVPIEKFKVSNEDGGAIDASAFFKDGGVETGVVDDASLFTWDFNVKTAGFYNFSVQYQGLKGTNSKIERKMLVDGKVLFDGMEQLVFNRNWHDEESIIAKKGNNEIRPRTIELYTEKTVFVDDSRKRTMSPYIFYLSSGKHTVTFENVREPAKIIGLTFKSAPIIPTYEEATSNLSHYDGDVIVCEAERIDGGTVGIEKSSTSIIINSNYVDPKLSPSHPYDIIFNTIGGDSFKFVGDSVKWTVSVPKDGLYQLTFKGRQSLNRGITSYRRLKINDEVPFAEASAIPFTFSADFNNYIFGTEEEPLLIPLKNGENTIELEVVLGNFGNSLTEIEESVLALNTLYRKTIQITGLAPQSYIDYELVKKIPNYKETLQQESERLFKVLDEFIAITGEKGETLVILEKLAMQTQELAKKPEDVIAELTQFKSNISALGTFIMKISEMPLELDNIILSEPKSKLPKSKGNFFEKLANDAVRFFSTFFMDENTMATDEEITKDATKVWLTTGRDQAQILRNMIDDSFVSEFGTKVNLELIPLDVVLRATLAGNGPDVVLSMNQATLSDFAVRDTLIDISKLPGFADEVGRYHKSAIDSLSYLDGVYGLPEQETFMMMFYRDDIMAELGQKAPKTWDEVRELIPVLYMNNYDFWIPTTAIFPSMLYQNGAVLYNGTGNDFGISTGLYSDNAMKAFKGLTDFFTSYKLPVVADFSNTFRTGEIPIGIAPYTTYSQLEIFAPEIRGLWSFAPIPGVADENGKINNTYVCETVGATILKNAKDVDSAWEFVKWWCSDDVQTRYANNLESVMGSAARYPTASATVLDQLPWSKKDAEQLLLQLENTVGIPAVPGSYMTTRMVDYAFKGAVTSGQNPLESLYLNLKAIDKELTKKREEFGLSTVQNQQISK